MQTTHFAKNDLGNLVGVTW